MRLDAATLLTLATACAPQVAPDTMLAVVRVESAGDPLAIGVNGEPRLALAAQTPAEAIRTASRLIAQGRSLDLGLGQINVRNLKPLGLRLADAFDPCRNLAAAARVLQADWRRAAPAPGPPLSALKTALSLYNTGDRVDGLRNGYAARVVAAASGAVPKPAALHPREIAAAPDWLVFGPASRTAFVTTPSEEIRP